MNYVLNIIAFINIIFCIVIFHPQSVNAKGGMSYANSIAMQDVFFEWMRYCYSPEAMGTGAEAGIPPEAPERTSINDYIKIIKHQLGDTTDKKVVTLAKKKKISGVPLPYLHIDENDLYVEMIREYTAAAEIAKRVGIPTEDYTPSVLTGKLLPNVRGGWTLIVTTKFEGMFTYGRVYFYDVSTTIRNGKLQYSIIRVEDTSNDTNPLMDQYDRHDFQIEKEPMADQIDIHEIYYRIDQKSGKLFLESDDCPDLALAFEWNGQRYAKKGLVRIKP